MRINKKTSSPLNNKLLVGVILTCLLVAAGVTYSYISRDEANKSGDINYQPPTKEQKQAGEDAKEGAIDRGGSTGETNPGTDVNPVTFSLTQDDESQTLVVSTKLANTASWNKCYLELSQGQIIKKYEARTVYQPAYSFCGGFSIPIVGLSGTWHVSLRANDLSGVSYEKTDSIEIH